MRQVSIARINMLMHQLPDSPLPPTSKRFQIVEQLADVNYLRELAQSRRPDLQALSNRLAADQAALGLAFKEFRPDFEVTAAYDAFWQEKPLRTMVGVEINLPVRTERRRAAVYEAQARIAQRQAELTRLADRVNFEVQEAYEQLQESGSVVRLYDKTTLPAAEANVKEALSAYANGKIPFLSLIEAQRSLIGLRDRYFESLADYFRRRATLERVVGGPLDK